MAVRHLSSQRLAQSQLHKLPRKLACRRLTRSGQTCSNHQVYFCALAKSDRTNAPTQGRSVFQKMMKATTREKMAESHVDLSGNQAIYYHVPDDGGESVQDLAQHLTFCCSAWVWFHFLGLAPSKWGWLKGKERNTHPILGVPYFEANLSVEQGQTKKGWPFWIKGSTVPHSGCCLPGKISP